MKKNMKLKEEIKDKRRCGVNTCIHCVIGHCMIDECEMFERLVVQEH